MKNYNLPTIHTYGDYSSSNYGAHCMRVDIPRSRTNKLAKSCGLVREFRENGII